jgi:hypothetical protein
MLHLPFKCVESVPSKVQLEKESMERLKLLSSSLIGVITLALYQRGILDLLTPNAMLHVESLTFNAKHLAVNLFLFLLALMLILLTLETYLVLFLNVLFPLEGLSRNLFVLLHLDALNLFLKLRIEMKRKKKRKW